MLVALLGVCAPPSCSSATAGSRQDGFGRGLSRIASTAQNWATRSPRRRREPPASGTDRGCGAEPEKVARHHDAGVEDVSLIDRRERLLHLEREHDHAEHLPHRREPEDPVVGVLARREPRVVRSTPRIRRTSPGRSPGCRCGYGQLSSRREAARGLYGGRLDPRGSHECRRRSNVLGRPSRCSVRTRSASVLSCAYLGGLAP